MANGCSASRKPRRILRKEDVFMNKKFLAMLSAAALMTGLMAGCGSNNGCGNNCGGCGC